MKPQTHVRLTSAQADATRAMYARLLAFSRERGRFLRVAKACGWGSPHIPELWAAHAIRRGFP